VALDFVDGGRSRSAYSRNTTHPARQAPSSSLPFAIYLAKYLGRDLESKAKYVPRQGPDSGLAKGHDVCFLLKGQLGPAFPSSQCNRALILPPVMPM
jgi:hypothetical protein